MALNVRAAGSRNEQFIAAALGVESPAGFMGYAFPVDLARHLYTNYGTLAPKQRLRRAKALSVRHATVNEFMSPRGQIWEEVRTDPFPGGVDGPLTWDDDAPRPRAFLPASVGVILGDDPEHKVLYAVYDAPGHRADVASLISLDDGTVELPPAESVDALVVIECAQTTTATALAWIADVERSGAPVVRVSSPPLRREIPQLSHVAERLAQTGRTPDGATFARVHPGAVTVALPADSAQAIAESGRWLVLSETWHLWGGWTVEAGDEPLTQHRADGVATAVWLPQGSATVTATYDPEGMGLALTLGAAAVIAALALALWPRREA